MYWSMVEEGCEWNLSFDGWVWHGHICQTGLQKCEKLKSWSGTLDVHFFREKFISNWVRWENEKIDWCVAHLLRNPSINELCELYRVKVQQEHTKSTRGAKVIRGPHNYFFHSWISSLFFTLQFNRMSFIRTSWPWNIWKKVFFLQPFAESSSPKFIVAR